MYKTDFICTYNKIDNEKESFILYQIQFLQAFDLNEFNEKVINEITESLYKKYKDNKNIIDMLKISTIELDDDLLKFRACFSYDTFHKLHYILCNIINN